jgi:ABC-2 type transport system ATP-binding protein
MSKENAIKSANFWLEKFDIIDWSKKRIEELSKGMAQKVQFIAALVHEPDLLILDEPLSGFDPLNVELILNELKSLKSQGKTIILSTHNMRSVEEICDRAALIHHSKKLAEDSVWNLRAAQKSGEFSIRFSGNMIAFANALWTDFELIDKKELGDNRFLAVVKMRGNNQINDLLNALMGQIKIEAVEERIPTMQEVFMNLISGKEVENA